MPESGSLGRRVSAAWIGGRSNPPDARARASSSAGALVSCAVPLSWAMVAARGDPKLRKGFYDSHLRRKREMVALIVVARNCAYPQRDPTRRQPRKSKSMPDPSAGLRLRGETSVRLFRAQRELLDTALSAMSMKAVGAARPRRSSVGIPSVVNPVKVFPMSDRIGLEIRKITSTELDLSVDVMAKYGKIAPKVVIVNINRHLRTSRPKLFPTTAAARSSRATEPEGESILTPFAHRRSIAL